jgi:hypothetical protein
LAQRAHAVWSREGAAQRVTAKLLPPRAVNMMKVACVQHQILRGTCHIRECQA